MEKPVQSQPFSWVPGVGVSKDNLDACLIHPSDGPLHRVPASGQARNPLCTTQKKNFDYGLT
jgi:hypothetical protein